MKPILLLTFLWSGFSVIAQTENVGLKTQLKDSLINAVKTGLNISKEKSSEVFKVIDQFFSEMKTIVKDTTKNGEQKVALLKERAKDRDAKVAAFLTTEQIQKLKAIMAKNKQRIKEMKVRKE